MIGKTLGSYTIEEELGAGGMAQVYRGRHVHLQRDVAIKVMHTHLSAKDDLRERFLREAQANASLKHPGIVQIYDFDVADGVCYIAMEMLEGRTLEDRAYELGDAGRARFDLDEAMTIATSLGAALAYAHAHGVVHRDIKPANVMLNADGRAVLTDFGLATVLDQTRLTVDGSSAGTPSYMSPEQAAGERGDHRADIYSLGVMLYQLLAGKLPFESETLVGMLTKLLHEPAPSLAAARPDLPEHVVATVDRALAKHPDERFDSVDDMLLSLRGEAEAGAAAAEPPFTPAEGSDAPAEKSDAPAEKSDATSGKSDATSAGQGAPAAGSATPATAATGNRDVGGRAPRAAAIAALLLIPAAAVVWWAVSTRDAADTTTGDGPGGGIESMTPKVESMVPEIESMVPEGADAPSMAAMSGWSDGFDDNAHGWELSEGDIARSLADGQYEIDVRIGGQAVSAVAAEGGAFDDVQYVAGGRLVEGQRESGYGLVFRRRDARNYYVFAVNGLGQFSLWALEDGAWRELRGLPQQWTTASAVAEDGVNRLQVRAVGDTITGWINEVEVVSVTDETFSSGLVGFYAASSRTAAAARTRVRFDDAEVTALPAAGADAPSMVGKSR